MQYHLFKKIALTAIMLVVAVSAFCVPAKRVWRTTTLADGTTVEVMLVGDEHGHWYVDRKGKALRKNANGRMEYLAADELADLKSRRKERMSKINAKRVERIQATRAMSAAANSDASTDAMHKTFGKPTTITGKKKGLVILVNFSDKSFQEANNRALFERRFNEEGYSDNGYIGSVHDYFYDQSYGKFDLTFDVIGPVTVSKTHDYYGANDKDGNDKYPGTMVIEALKLADAQGVDFSKYDWDGDGMVEQVFVIYAGTGEAVSEITTDIWPHEYELSYAKQRNDGSGPQTIDGVKIDTYAVSCELANSTTIDGLGTAVHEFSHCLGYADLYDTDYSGGPGMMYWDVLDAGSYSGPNQMGEVPTAYTSFERWWAGWMDFTVLDEPRIITDMPAINDEGVAYKIVNDASPNEYFILENRQAKRWDLYTAGYGDGTGHGMLILHVDYDEETWMENAPNDDPERQRMTFVPADNSFGTFYPEYSQWGASNEQLAGDPYPGTSKNTAFTDDSTPASTLYNANTDGTKKLGKPVTKITEKDGKISFVFMGGVKAPVAKNATDISKDGTSFIANWKAVQTAKNYDLEVKAQTDASTAQMLSEDFSKITKTNTQTDISKSLDSYLNTAGWTGQYIYQNTGKVKLGKRSGQGLLTSCALAAPTTGEITLKIKPSVYSTDNKYIDIQVWDEAETQCIASQGNVEIPAEETDYVVSFTGITSKFKVKIQAHKATSNRFYLSDIKVYDGSLTAEELSRGSNAKEVAKASSGVGVFTGITSTSYAVTGLTPGEKYKYRVRAFLGDAYTSWSDYVLISTPTVIEAVSSDISGKASRIYNLNGQYVGTDMNNLPRGIYIIGTRKYIKR